jgi:hypothetical protein
MEDFLYKEYSEEESNIYNEAMDKIMEGLSNGLAFHAACDSVHVEDEKLREFIMDDALKIMIADIHYIKGFSLQHVADSLQVSIDTIQRANTEMLEDIGTTVAEMYRIDNPGSPTGNA